MLVIMMVMMFMVVMMLVFMPMKVFHIMVVIFMLMVKDYIEVTRRKSSLFYLAYFHLEALN